MKLHCSYENTCGSCLGFAKTYEETLLVKQAYVQKLFPGKKVEPVIGMENPVHYRHKVYASFGYNKKGRLSAGMYEENSHDLVFAPNCMIQNETANHVISSLINIARKHHLEPYDLDSGKMPCSR